MVAGHPAVAECAVIGVADTLKGQHPRGFVVLKSGVDTDPDQLRSELVRLREEEAREVDRILAEWTARLRQRAPEIRAAVDAMARLEFIFAKAAFGREFNAVIPVLSPETARRLEIRDARHPLLEDIRLAR